jgi:hypothetical protein
VWSSMKNWVELMDHSLLYLMILFASFSFVISWCMYVGKVPNILKTCGGNELNLHTSLTSVLDEGCPQLNASSTLSPGKTYLFPQDRRLVGPRILLDCNTFTCLESNPVLQSINSRFSDWAIPVHCHSHIYIYIYIYIYLRLNKLILLDYKRISILSRHYNLLDSRFSQL